MSTESRLRTVILAIDPGTTQSGYCQYNGSVLDSGVRGNKDLLSDLVHAKHCTLAIEMVAGYGMPVGAEVFETVRWIGRFQQAFHDPDAVRFVYRKDVKLYLCGSLRAKDANVWQALIDQLGPVGTKAAPGPLYGVKSHARSALAVAVTALHQMKMEML